MKNAKPTQSQQGTYQTPRNQPYNAYKGPKQGQSGSVSKKGAK
jgi:hypothetical protein